MEKIDSNLFIEKCKMEMYVIFTNCKLTVSHIISSIYEKFYPDNSSDNSDNSDNDNTYIDDNNYQNQNKEEIFILGKKYNFNTQTIKKEIEKIQYFSYRKNFQIPLKNNLTDDIGWGCMIRTGQMMLCHTLKKSLNKSNDEIVSYFFDTPDAPFSIHKITENGEKRNFPVGKWFNPSGIGYVMKELVSTSQETKDELQIIVGKDGTIYEDEIVSELQNNKKVLILVPVMLGTEKINDICYRSLLKCFELKSSLGIVGGKPMQSFYFIGKQKENIFFLDPHTVKPALLSIPDNNSNNKKDIDELIKYIDISDLSPSMLLCFLVSSNEEFVELKNNIDNNSEFPIFAISEKSENNENNIFQDLIQDFD